MGDRMPKEKLTILLSIYYADDYAFRYAHKRRVYSGDGSGLWWRLSTIQRLIDEGWLLETQTLGISTDIYYSLTPKAKKMLASSGWPSDS